MNLLFFVQANDINEEQLNNLIQQSQFRNIATGRVSWHSETISRFAQKHSIPEFTEPLLAAGFAFGSESYLQRFLEGLTRSSRWCDLHSSAQGIQVMDHRLPRVHVGEASN
ncbi:hypothetical protein [Pseudomonas sp. CDFA 610]|uniref:hypothetical protein n=1 Tax=Pseudomonas sp. CDFA 610 TaxID=2829825 RepID=UPI001E645016|nr:hypothetical protein [Pseudomonas sp. CDFA 610]MCD5981175.1 hypothetical protein [Pseudomonas sp. CDFA 610]